MSVAAVPGSRALNRVERQRQGQLRRLRVVHRPERPGAARDGDDAPPTEAPTAEGDPPPGALKLLDSRVQPAFVEGRYFDILASNRAVRELAPDADKLALLTSAALPTSGRAREAPTREQAV